MNFDFRVCENALVVLESLFYDAVHYNTVIDN